jgi:hypothetical protein
MCQSVVAGGQLQPWLLSAKIVNDVDTSVSSLSRLPPGGLLGVPMHARGARIELSPLSRRKSRVGDLERLPVSCRSCLAVGYWALSHS